MRQIRPGLLFLMTALLMIFQANGACADTTVVKIALITPDGSTWTRTLRKMTAEITSKTEGEINFKIYSGGVSGDELDVLRKMRANRIHAAGFSGVGLGVLLPEIRILEAPLLFRDNLEIDHIKEYLFQEIAEGFTKKGYKLLGFAEAGFVYFFSKENIADVKGLRNAKMWAWKGDPVAETFLSTFGINTFPLHLADVNTGLETGMIDAFYSPPLAAVAFQWHTKIRYMLDHPMVNSTGALLMNRRTFEKLSRKNKTILEETALKYCRELVRLTRKDNQEALEVLQEDGITFVSPTAGQTTSFLENARKTHLKNMPDLYSRDLYDRVRQRLEKFRKQS
jgi:TRAP-type transport system periplasmic protein